MPELCASGRDQLDRDGRLSALVGAVAARVAVHTNDAVMMNDAVQMIGVELWCEAFLSSPPSGRRTNQTEETNTPQLTVESVK